MALKKGLKAMEDLEDKVHDAIDISTNIQRCLHAIEHIYGLNALFMFLALGYLNYWICRWAWYYDIAATAQFAGEWIQGITNVGQAVDPLTLGQIISGATYVPTVVEMIGGLFARVNFQFARWLLYIVFLFDAYTDWPRVQATMEGLRPENTLWLPVFWFGRIVFLVMATAGFEHMLAVFTVVLISLFFRIFISSGKRLGKSRIIEQ